ncbi:MAG: extracellular solute-binding protein [Sphaerochaetaceae bacterium]|nr:extracellular solute-binding protein [Sphaerochaetaceae bacterium]
MKKTLLIVLALLLVVGPLFAAGSSEKSSVTATGKTKLTYWAPLNPNISSVVQDFSQTIYFQTLMERTNTDISFQHVPASNDSVMSEGFNILIASGNYPDIIEYKWIDYPGGPQAAIDDGVIISLNDVFEKYCPNITKFLAGHPDIAKMISTDDGTYYVFPFLRGESYENNNLIFTEGWVWRLDLLQKVGISKVPSTPDELYTALKALQGIGVQLPLTLRKDHVSRVLSPGFDSWDDFYVVDGVVHNGLIESTRKGYLEFTHKLYAEGLLDNDYLSVDKKSQAVKVLNNLCAATYAPGGSGIGTWLPAMQQSDPSVELVSARPISPDSSRYSRFAKMSTIYSNSGPSAAISTSCKNVEAAAKLLDYNFSEEGHLLVNFGIEGVSYTMVDGYPKYTDMILNNPDGLTISQAMAQYMRSAVNGPFIQDPRYLEQYYSIPELQEAINLWAQTDYGKYVLPPVSATSEEASELAKIMNNVKTYSDEMESKFITGALPISEFDTYVNQLKKFGLERAVEIKQACYDRYMEK